MLIFALHATRSFGERLAAHLDAELAPQEERELSDGEHASRALITVRGRHVFVVQAMYADAEQGVDDKLNRLLFFAAALKDAGAARVTAVAPYLCYTRQDRRTRPRDSLTLRYIAAMLETAGVDHL